MDEAKVTEAVDAAIAALMEKIGVMFRDEAVEDLKQVLHRELELLEITGRI